MDIDVEAESAAMDKQQHEAGQMDEGTGNVGESQQDTQDTAVSEAADAEEAESTRPKPARAPRKRKRLAIEAHLHGLTNEERAAIFASIQQDNVTPEPGSVQLDADDEGVDEHLPSGPQANLSGSTEEEIQERRRIIRTSWRMAAISQFHVTFPQLSLRDFDVGRLEADLDGSSTVDEPGLYAGHVIGRLLYTLTKDSRLAGDPRETPWLVRLRREYLKRDPAHNSLGDEPPELEDDASIAEHASPGPTDEKLDVKPSLPDLDGSQSEAAAAYQPQQSQSDMQVPKLEITSAEPTALSGEVSTLPTTTTSYGWEHLTVEQKIHAVWSCCEWHFSNAEKFRNYLNKYRVEDEHALWRVEPLGRDSGGNVYWLFDDNRLWIERETPRKHELRLVSEEAGRLKAARRRAHKKAMRIRKRERLRAFHDKRREQLAIKLAAEQSAKAGKQAAAERAKQEVALLDAQIAEEDAAAEAALRAKGKRKRQVSDSEDEVSAADISLRSSARLTRGRAAKPKPPPSRLSSRLRATRSGVMEDEKKPSVDAEWQAVPPEWLKSEEQEKDEDPDFGAAEIGDESMSEASDIDDVQENEDDVIRSKRRTSTRGNRPSTSARPSASSRRSPRKVQASDSKTALEEELEEELADSDLSELSDLGEEGEERDSDEEILSKANNRTGRYPDSAYNTGPSFDDEDKDLPDGFHRWEAICTNLDEWAAFEDRFPNSTHESEVSLLAFVSERILPGVKADYERREEEKRKKAAAAKRAALKAKAKSEQLSVPATTSSASSVQYIQGGRQRSSRLAKREHVADAERKLREAESPLHYSDGGTRRERDPSEQRVVESDRRAQRARQREEEKRQREEAALLAALSESAAQQDEDGSVVKTEGQDPAGALTNHYAHEELSVMPDTSFPMQTEAGSSSVTLPGIQAFNDVTMEDIPVGAEEVPFESDDYYLDCSVCKRRGMNLDVTAKLVQCDHCDRWEHVVCHRKADERAGLPKRDFDVVDFVCEDCDGLANSSVVIPSAPKRARSDKQMAGAIKGALKRKQKLEQQRLEKVAKDGGSAASPVSTPTVATASATRKRPSRGKAQPAIAEARSDSFDSLPITDAVPEQTNPLSTTAMAFHSGMSSLLHPSTTASMPAAAPAHHQQIPHGDSIPIAYSHLAPEAAFGAQYGYNTNGSGASSGSISVPQQGSIPPQSLPYTVPNVTNGHPPPSYPQYFANPAVASAGIPPFPSVQNGAQYPVAGASQHNMLDPALMQALQQSR